MTIKQVSEFLDKCLKEDYIELSYNNEWSILSIPLAGAFSEALKSRPDFEKEFLAWDNEDEPWYADNVFKTANVITILFKRIDQKYIENEINEFCK